MSEDSSEQSELEPGLRRSYEPPRIVETAEFETLALSCGKFPYPDACYYDGTSSQS